MSSDPLNVVQATGAASERCSKDHFLGYVGGWASGVAIDRDGASGWIAAIVVMAADALEEQFAPDVILIESGGDNLASTFSRELVDHWVFVIDVAGGDDIPRKRGPGVLQCDLLVVNKIDLAPYVKVDLQRMLAEAREIRNGRPVLTTNCAQGEGIESVAEWLCYEAVLTERTS